MSYTKRSQLRQTPQELLYDRFDVLIRKLLFSPAEPVVEHTSRTEIHDEIDRILRLINLLKIHDIWMRLFSENPHQLNLILKSGLIARIVQDALRKGLDGYFLTISESERFEDRCCSSFSYLSQGFKFLVKAELDQFFPEVMVPFAY